MMRDSFSLRSLLYFAACFVGLLLFSSSVSAQVELSVRLGFEGRLTPGHYAPIQIEVRNYRDLGSSRLRIVQFAGNEWRGEATIQQELGYAVQSDGLYEAVIPIYDPVNPIVVELVSSTDAVFASETIDLRRTMRPFPYPVLDKQIPRFDDRAAIIDMALLPKQWWAFDSAESLWVASPLPSESWSAISQWVLAGGSLVLLTGTNFYRMDSPALRDLLPLSNPVLAVSDLGTSYLAGSHVGATIDMLSEEGFPLLIQSTYGAGHVALVTVHAQSLSVENLESIAREVSSAQLITLRDSTEHILGAQTVVTLDSLFVLAMGGLLGVVVCTSAFIGKRSPRAGWAVLLVCAISFSVLSGLVSNSATHDVDLYTVNTHLSLDIGLGLYAGFSSLYSQTSNPFIQLHKEEIIPVLFLPRTLKGMDSYGFSTSPAHTGMSILPGSMRHWHAYGTAASLFDVKLLSDSSVRISSHSPLDFAAGWVIIDGMVHSITGVRRGVYEYSFVPESAVRLATFVGSAYTHEMTSALLLIRELQAAFSLTKGIWLITVADTERIGSGEITRKVRDITLVVVRGEEIGSEI